MCIGCKLKIYLGVGLFKKKVGKMGLSLIFSKIKGNMHVKLN